MVGSRLGFVYYIYWIMQEEKDPFGETLFKQLSSRTQGQEEDHCCPWSDELQNYRKQPGFT